MRSKFSLMTLIGTAPPPSNRACYSSLALTRKDYRIRLKKINRNACVVDKLL